MLELNETSIIIPFKKDFDKRLNNLYVNLNYLNKNFDVDILIVEMDVESKIEISKNRHLCINSESWNKCIAINEAVKNCDNKVIAVIDSDVIQDKMQYLYAQNEILNNFDLLLNSDKPFINVKRTSALGRNWDIKDIKSKHLKYKRSKKGFGGSVWFFKDSFIKFGMMNENMIYMGREDKELYLRASKLGYKVGRRSCDIYHMKHPRNKISQSDLDNNKKEFSKIKSMDKEELKKYVSSWEWCFEK